jgi:RNAse (barnase) inhibitor barstar
MKEITIDGNNFSCVNGFYDEIEAKLTKGLKWKIGRNLNAINDVLRGGFGVHDYEEPFVLIWLNAQKSSMGLEKSNEVHEGFFDLVIDIINEHKNIMFELK